MGKAMKPQPRPHLSCQGPWESEGHQGSQEGALLVTSILLEDWCGVGVAGEEGQGKPES